MINPAGILLAVLGVWVGCQVYGGNALERIGLLPSSGTGHAKAGKGSTPRPGTPGSSGHSGFAPGAGTGTTGGGGGGGSF